MMTETEKNTKNTERRCADCSCDSSNSCSKASCETINADVSKFDVEKQIASLNANLCTIDEICDIKSNTSDADIINASVVLNLLESFVTLRDETKNNMLLLQKQSFSMQSSLTERIEEYKETLDRLRASFEEEKKLCNKEFIFQTLELIDNLELIRSYIESDKNDYKTIVSAISVTYSRAQLLMTQSGVCKMSVQAGDIFDAKLHDAITLQSSDKIAKGYVLSVVKAGYTLYNNVLRPAAVIVATD